MADYRPLVLSGTAANSIITELPTSSILIADGIRAGASSLSVSGYIELTGGISGTPSISATTINAISISATTITSPDFIFSSTDSIIALSVSATTVSSTAFTGGTFKGSSVSSTTVSSVAYTGKTYNASTSVTTPRVISIEAIPAGTASITASTVSSLSVSADTRIITPVASATVFSGLEINGMPYPAPFAYVECSAAGTNTNDEINFASGATTTTVISNSAHIAWNDGEKYFTVSAAGTYELLGNFVVDSGSQSDPIELRAKKNGSTFHTISPKLYGNVGPEERTFHSIFTATAGDYLTVSIQMDDGGSKTAHLETGSNLTLKRIK